MYVYSCHRVSYAALRMEPRMKRQMNTAEATKAGPPDSI